MLFNEIYIPYGKILYFYLIIIAKYGIIAFI